MKITNKPKDPWWLVFKIVLVLILALSLWSVIFPRIVAVTPIIQGK